MDSALTKRIIFITGGARSGKSRYAEQRAADFGGRKVYVATAEAKDEEMAQRIAAHKQRRGDAWQTVEEPLQLARTLLAQRGGADCALVDCLTLWLSNVLLQHPADFAAQRVDELMEALPALDFHLILVANEVGWGIVPDNALARRFRDLAGWTHQRLAAAADEVVLTVAGVPMIVKQTAP
jgi:adenosylcobinamide kinase / adenosylcobinamide-phosphate guanylyltransferase